MITNKDLEPLKEVATKKSVAVLTFIATDQAIRISPGRSSFVQISTNDVYTLEEKVERIHTDIVSAFLLLHSPGGNLTSSYNIARFLRQRFANLHIFVPYEAASGATLMTLAANKITLGELGYLTPIDPQVYYKGEWVSSFGLVEEVQNLERKFENMLPEEMPIPWRQMADKLDIVLYREMNTDVYEASTYARKLLLSAGYDSTVANNITFTLSRNIYSHGHCYHREECKEMGLKIDDTSDFMSYLTVMKKLVDVVNKQPPALAGHYIEVVLPDDKPSTSNDVSVQKPSPTTRVGLRSRRRSR